MTAPSTLSEDFADGAVPPQMSPIAERCLQDTKFLEKRN